MVRIYKGTTRLRVIVDPHSDAFRMIGSYLQKYAFEWEFDPRWKKYFPTAKFYKYNERMRELRIPAGYLDPLRDYLTQMGIQTEVSEEAHCEPLRHSLQMNPEWQVRDNQVEPLKFLSNDEPGMRGLSLQTGMGKSFIATKAMVDLGYVSLVIVSGLIEQWVEFIQKCTNVGDNIYVLQGFKSIAKLIESNYRPPIMIGSLETLRLYANRANDYDLLPLSFEEFQQHFGIGTKVLDEVHEKYYTTAMIDMFSNVRNNLYLSATFNRNNPSSRKIFNTIYPEAIRFSGGTYTKYVNVYVYSYQLAMSEAKVVRQRGYNHAKYEQQIMKNEWKTTRFFQQILKPAINIHYNNIRNNGEKLLIYFSTIEMVKLAQQQVAQMFPELNVITYIQDDSNEKYKDEKAEVIISIPKKSGTGTDIPNLRTVISTVSIQAATQVEQMLGRLRQLKNGITPHYVDLYNESLMCHRRHILERMMIYRPRALAFYEHRMH